MIKRGENISTWETSGMDSIFDIHSQPERPAHSKAIKHHTLNKDNFRL